MRAYRIDNKDFYEPVFPDKFIYKSCEEKKVKTYFEHAIRWYLSRIPAAHTLDEISTETVFGPLLGFCSSFDAKFGPVLDEDVYESSVTAWYNYLLGACHATHDVDGRKEQLLHPVKLIATSQLHFRKTVFNFIDEMEEIKELITPHFQADQAVIRYGEEYIRGVCCSFTMPLGTMDLQESNAGLLFQSLNFNDISMPLYIPEQSYETAEEAIADLHDPEKLELGKVFELLFGAQEDSEERISDITYASISELEEIPLIEDIDDLCSLT